MSINFGTDGWRGLIGKDFTVQNVRIAAQATADCFLAVSDQRPAVFIGYDVRFLSPESAQATAEVFSGNGFDVLLIDRPYPTPCVSFEVRRRNLVGGIVITASHNASDFNGFKVKTAFGGSAPPSITEKIESLIGKNPVRSSTERIQIVSPTDEYATHIKALVDWDTIAASKLSLVVDSMHGSGGFILQDLLSHTSCSVKTIRGEADPLFGGVHPEPMELQLKPLAATVLDSGCDLGLATDGDADRLGVVDENGVFVSTLQILPLLLLHVYRNRGWRGRVAYTVSQSQLVEHIASELGLETIETPVGFKNVAQLMLENEILIGGEESGGIGLSKHLPERDGLFINLLVLDLLARSQKALSALIRDMWDEFGEFHYSRKDLCVDSGASEKLFSLLKSGYPKEFGSLKVTKMQTLDGIKFRLEPDSWILFRRSGTEPVLRIYCEAPNQALVESILESGVELVEQFT